MPGLVLGLIFLCLVFGYVIYRQKKSIEYDQTLRYAESRIPSEIGCPHCGGVTDVPIGTVFESCAHCGRND